MKKILTLSGLLLLGTSLAVSQLALSQTSTADLTIYTGRNRSTIEPLVKQYQQKTGLKINVVYGNDTAMLEQLGKESKTPKADIFIGNSARNLDTFSKNKQFWKLPNSAVSDIAPNLISASQDWLPIALRFRVLAYNRDNVKPEQLPQSIFELEKWKNFKGKIGWAPLDSGFQEIVGHIANTQGENTAKTWLQAIIALEPQDYGSGNTGMLEDVGNGILDVVFTGHTTMMRIQRAGYRISAHMFKAGDAGNLKDSSGAGILKSSRRKSAGLHFLRYLVGAEAQSFIYGVNFEYPAAASVPYPTTLTAYQDVAARCINLAPSSTLTNITLGEKLLTEVGVL